MSALRVNKHRTRTSDNKSDYDRHQQRDRQADDSVEPSWRGAAISQNRLANSASLSSISDSKVNLHLT